AVDLTNPDLYSGGNIALQKDIVHIGRTIFLWRGTAYQRIAVRNHGLEPVEIALSFHFDNDFADLFEVRGERRARRGTTSRRRIAGSDQVLLSYKGLDETWRRTTLEFDPSPSELDESKAVYRLTLAPHESVPLFL